MPDTPSAAQTDCPACEDGYICRQGEGCLLVEVFGDEHPAATTTPTVREAKLVTALLNVANRTDGDGKPCWCHDEMRSGLFAPEHTPWCRAAREAVDA